MSVMREFAGAERLFRLRYGDVMDLEEACGRGVLSVYRRLAAFEAGVAEVFHTIRLGLIGGGMAEAEARRLVVERFDAIPLARLVDLAAEILVVLLEGAPKAAGKTGDGDPEQPIDAGAVFKNFAQVGIGPNAVRDMRFGDVLRIYEAASRDGSELAPSEDEFEAMLARLDSPEMAWARAPAKKG